MALIEMRGIGKRYTAGERTVEALTDVGFSVERGEMVAILGRSGSGKSTLMNILGCLDTPSVGEYRLNGRCVARMNERELTAVRRETVGFVFQSFHLLAGLTAMENVELPLLYRGMGERERKTRAADCLRRVGLAERMHHHPHQLSGGQQQRVAIARAMAGRPPLLLADEPTGNLDSAAGEEILSLLWDWHRAGNTVVLITHDRALGAACPRRLYIRDGRLSDREA